MAAASAAGPKTWVEKKPFPDGGVSEYRRYANVCIRLRKSKDLRGTEVPSLGRNYKGGKVHVGKVSLSTALNLVCMAVFGSS